MSATEDIDRRFAPFAARMRAAGLQPLNITAFRHYYGELLRGNTGLIPEASLEPVADLPDAEALDGYAASGRAAMRRVVVLKLNGGLGTSMGLDRAKSLLPVKDGHSFLDIIARQVLSARARYGCAMPLLLMNSFNTRDDSLAALARFPELQGPLPLDFMQNVIPKVLQENLAPAEWPADPDLEWCPPGHGDLYTALVTSGVFDALVANGFEYLFVSNADNLGAVIDEQILGYVAENEIPFLMEVADRTEADKKGGHLARLQSGQLTLRESAQAPDEEQDIFQDIERHRYFNTNNIWLRVSALRDLFAHTGEIVPLPMIRNAKTLDPKDSASPGVYQLETAMGAAIAVIPGAQAVRVPRKRFAPVKLTSDLLALWSDLYVLTPAWNVELNPARELGPITIQLDPRYFKLIDDLEARVPDGAPSLLHCERLAVRGDVRFERDIRITGDVVIDNPGPGQLVIAAGSHLE